MLRSFFGLLVLLLSLTSAAGAHAQSDPAMESPSAFRSGYRGLLTGGLLGLSAGYLVARPDGLEGDDWRPLTLASGIGALSGAGLGLAVGLLDSTGDVPGYGSIAMRDMLYGVGFGAVTGAIAGGLAVIETQDAEHVLLGTSVGVLVGAALGLTVGIIEGERYVDRARRRTGPKVSATISVSQNASGGRVWSPALVGSF